MARFINNDQNEKNDDIDMEVANFVYQDDVDEEGLNNNQEQVYEINVVWFDTLLEMLTKIMEHIMLGINENHF